MAEINRRNFFRQAVVEAVQSAREVIPAVELLTTPTERPAKLVPAPIPEVPDDQPTEPATPASHSASIEEMLVIAAELGLGARAEDLRRLAVSSARLTPAPGAGGSSFAGGEPIVPDTVEVPEPLDGGPPGFVALLDLPESGRVWVFRFDLGAEDPDAGETKAPAPIAVFEADPTEPIPRPPAATPLSVSQELILPRPWSAVVDGLALSLSEQDSWQELRTRLAAAQGVPLGESAPRAAAIHRLGGYPDERRGDMPLICELRLLGVDLAGKPPATHPLAGALEGKTDSWRLLAQLGADDDLGWSWGPGYQRLYVWGQVEDSAPNAVGRVEVVVQ